jgi:hypothetical protein
VVPWVDLRQVEQDLIISRAIVNLFSDTFLNEPHQKRLLRVDHPVVVAPAVA